MVARRARRAAGWRGAVPACAAVRDRRVHATGARRIPGRWHGGRRRGNGSGRVDSQRPDGFANAAAADTGALGGNAITGAAAVSHAAIACSSAAIACSSAAIACSSAVGRHIAVAQFAATAAGAQRRDHCPGPAEELVRPDRVRRDPCVLGTVRADRRSVGRSRCRRRRTCLDPAAVERSATTS